MFPVALSGLTTFAVFISTVSAQKATYPATPLTQKHYAYPTGIPYKVDTEDLIRGTQFGYNICNSTTEGQNSLCQTAFVNSLPDFCLWGPPEPNSIVGNTEGEMVAWCSKPGHGTRLIPRNTLKGVQFMRTSEYVQVVGFLDQAQINIQHGDYGGEMDPHGADLRGNPLGSLLYSNAWSANKEEYKQVIEWHNFIGSDIFCFKACDPERPNDNHFCEHIYDRVGCKYNAPNNAQIGVFESCEGEPQDYPGVYVENGVTKTWHQPGEGIEPSPPYEPRVPPSSNCQAFKSAEIYADADSKFPLTTTSASTSATGSLTANSANSTPGTASRTASSPNSQNTGGTGDAVTLSISGFSILSVILSALFLS